MSIHKKLWNWCQRPIRPASTSFVRLATPLYAAILVGSLIIAACAAVALLPLPTMVSLRSNHDETEGWVPKELERISFPGGDIAVRKIQYNPFEKGYISIHIEAHITSEEDLSAYVGSRTNALNIFLDSINPNSTIEVAAITFRAPIKPEELMSLCEISLVKLGEYAVIITNEVTGEKSTMVLGLPRPQDPEFIQNLTFIKDGYRLEGIIAAECYVKAEMARILQSDPTIRLVDPSEDLTIIEIKKKYNLMGFDVEVSRPFSYEMWSQYVKLEHEAEWISQANP
jgi:hypothetical protein